MRTVLISRCYRTLSQPSLPLPSLIRASKTIGNLEQVHSQIIRRGLEQDHFLINEFVSLLSSLSTSIIYLTTVFERVSSPNIYLYNTLIKASSQHSSLSHSISIFKRLKTISYLSPDKCTFPSLIKACSNELNLKSGAALHGLIFRYGTEGDVFVGSSLIDMYGKCKEIECARKLFDGMLVKNVVSWTAMLVGYLNFGKLEEAKSLYDEMPERNLATWNAMIGGLAKFGDLMSAKKLFDMLLVKNVVSFTTMIDGYAKSGDMASARFLFDQCKERDIVSWSALISGYAQNGQPNEAVKIFLEMWSMNVKPDEFIMVSLMSACSQLGCLELAKWVDSYVSLGFDLGHAHVAAALVDMNAKCGNIKRAMVLFEGMPERDLISYCSMMQGLSIHGCGLQAVRMFDRMLSEGLQPDDVAFTVILTACSRAGLVKEGCNYFDSMVNEYSLKPSPDHYACMVDLLGRSGQLKAAYELIKSMPVEPHAGAWGALLGACRLHGDAELGQVVAHRLFEVEPQNAANYVLLSDIYATTDRWLDVSRLRFKLTEKGLRKIPGCSWV